MKNLYKIGSFLLASAVLCFFPAVGQTISNTYQGNSVQHKFPNKWYQIRQNQNISQAAKDMDTFDDENPSMTNTYAGINIQAAHTYIDTLYVRKGSDVQLRLPTIPADFDGRSSTRAYQRWYNFVTEGTFHYSYSSGRYTRSGDLVSFRTNCYRFANGYVGGANLGLGNRNIILDYAEFHYPTDDEYNTWKISNGTAENKYYIVACDASGYTDFTTSFISGNGSSFNRNYIEPTLGLRVIYYIIAVDDRGGADDANETEMWKNGYGRLSRSEFQGGDGVGKKFLEEYNITFPCDHLGNQTDELVALSKYASGYRRANDDNDILTVEMTSGDDVFTLLNEGNTNSVSGGIEVGNTITLSGMRRTISFRKRNAYKAVRDGNKWLYMCTPWSVDDGQTATIIVTKTVGGTKYNIAKFNLTFKKENRLLTQHQLDRIDKQRDGDNTNITSESWYKNSYLYRTPEYLRNNYRLLTSRTFDYDPDVATQYGQSWYYPFPLEWGYSSYAFFDGAKTNDFDLSSTYLVNNGSYPGPLAEWGYYAITNEYVGYGDRYSNSVKRPKSASLGGKKADGYFIYVDASDRPGTVMTLPFNENLCKGTKLLVSAWVKSADENKYTIENSAMLFTIYGVDADGNKTPLFSQSTGQITTTTFLTSSDGNEYTDANGYGSGQNDWYQLFFSFVNEDAKNANFVSYELKIDNNCGSTSGGDFYLDEIEVFIAQPTATVAQKDYTCSGERTLLSASLDWAQLCDRVGLDPDETDQSATPEGIDFCFIDEVQYNLLLNGKENPTEADILAAIQGSVVKIGAGEDAGYDREIASLYYKKVFTDNTEYVSTDKNLALNNTDNQHYYFYRTGTADEENRRLIVDFYSAMSPNRPYVMLIRDSNPDGTLSTFADFAKEINDPCAINSRFFVTSQTLVKINGEVANPQTDYCEGQTFNFTAQMRVPKLDENGEIIRDPETGEEQFEVVDSEVFFDWFFGDEEEFVKSLAEYGGESLQLALQALRDVPAYRDVTSLENVVPVAPEPGVHNGLTQDQINLIQYYLDQPGQAGGLNKRLVLCKSGLDIAILSTGLQVVISPIPAVWPSGSSLTPAQWEKICWDYVPLRLTGNGEAPKLHAGFNSVEYPSDDFNPNLRIGLSQIKNVSTGTATLTLSLRGAKYTDDAVDHLGLIDIPNSNVDYAKLYLIATDDPQYSDLMNSSAYDQYYLPIGELKSLEAHEYNETSPFTNEAKLQFNLAEQNLVDGTKFTFNPREGYSYTFSIHFAERGETVNNSCWGTFPVTMKVVPANLVWRGSSATSNWNDDKNWKRADNTHLKNTDGTYITNAQNTTDNGFVPMLFSNVIMPQNSKAELYMAGYAQGGEGNGDGWVHNSRPDYMESPTENIQYDLMAYDKDNALTTQRYRVNICRDIHFEPGAQMLHAEELLYNKAWTDVEVEPGKWTLVSTPLKDVVAGDWYVPTSGQQATEYFKDITFADGVYNRLNPAIYQRSWSDGAKIVEQVGGTNNNPMVSFATEWSSVYNDASVPYSAGAGSSLKAVTSGQTTPLLFRFPKADASYDVSTATVSLSRGDAGKLLVSDMVDRSNPYQYVHPDEVTVTLTPSVDGKYLMVGNPFMTSLDVRQFVEANPDVLAQKYWYVTADGSTQADALENGNWTATDAYQAAPYSAFYVEANDPTAAKDNGIEVKFTADMQVPFTQTSGTASASQARALQIEAADSHGSSQALLSYSAQADNACASEDAVLLSNLSGNATAAPQVYTVAGNTAVSVNWLKDAQQIPLGVFAASDDDDVTLTFTGLGALRSPRLYDAELNTETPLSEGYQLTVKGSSHGRYFLRSLGSALTGLTPTTTDPELTVYSVRAGELIVSSNATLQSVQVFTADGRRLSPLVQSQTDCVWRLSGVDKGVVMVEAKTDGGHAVRKVMVK